MKLILWEKDGFSISTDKDLLDVSNHLGLLIHLEGESMINKYLDICGKILYELLVSYC